MLRGRLPSRGGWTRPWLSRARSCGEPSFVSALCRHLDERVLSGVTAVPYLFHTKERRLPVGLPYGYLWSPRPRKRGALHGLRPASTAAEKSLCFFGVIPAAETQLPERYAQARKRKPPFSAFSLAFRSFPALTLATCRVGSTRSHSPRAHRRTRSYHRIRSWSVHRLTDSLSRPRV